MAYDCLLCGSQSQADLNVNVHNDLEVSLWLAATQETASGNLCRELVTNLTKIQQYG